MKLDATLDIGGDHSEQVFRLVYINANIQTGLSSPMDEAILAKETPDLNNVKKLNEVPYDFQRKWLSVLVQRDGEKLLVTKGALLSVLSICTYYRICKSFEILDDNMLSQINGVSQSGASKDLESLD